MSLIPWRNKREDRAGLIPAESPLARFRDEMENMFDRFFSDPWGSSLAETPTGRAGWGPRMDLAETENEVTVTAEVPGVDPKELQIDVNGNMLTVRGEKKQEKEEKRKNYHYTECHYGSFQRSVQLPSSVDPEKVDAAFKDGVLTVTLAKRADAKPKKIAVRNA